MNIVYAYNISLRMSWAGKFIGFQLFWKRIFIYIFITFLAHRLVLSLEGL